MVKAREANSERNEVIGGLTLLKIDFQWSNEAFYFGHKIEAMKRLTLHHFNASSAQLSSTFQIFRNLILWSIRSFEFWFLGVSYFLESALSYNTSQNQCLSHFSPKFLEIGSVYPSLWL